MVLRRESGDMERHDSEQNLAVALGEVGRDDKATSQPASPPQNEPFPENLERQETCAEWEERMRKERGSRGW